MTNLLSFVAIVLSMASFVLFAFTVPAEIKAKADASKASAIAATHVEATTQENFVASETAPSVDKLVDVLKAATAAVEAITKAGPALAALAAAVLFLSVAAWTVSNTNTGKTFKCTVPAGTEISVAKTTVSINLVCEQTSEPKSP